MGQNHQPQASNGADEDIELDCIQDLYKTFIKECPSGSLHLHEFKRMFGVQHGTPEAQYMDGIFRAFDMNHDNTLEFMEYVAALHLVLRGKLEDKLRWSFKVFDGDENGRLDRGELKKIIRVIYKIKQISDVRDETGTETLTPDQVTDRIFQKIDINGDGQITLEEFMEGAKNDPWVENFLRMDINPNAYVMSHMTDRRLSGAKR